MVEHNWLLYIAAFACAFAITLVTTPFAKWLSVKCGAIDYPKDRGVHKKPMPRMGGVAIVLGFTITVLMVNYFDKSMDSRQFAGFLVGALLIAGLGVVDDMKNLPAKLKFCVQILAALIVIFSGTRIQVVLWPVTAYLQKFSIPITLVWIVGVTNAVNLIDGLDGLAAGVTSIAAMSLMVLCRQHNGGWLNGGTGRGLSGLPSQKLQPCGNLYGRYRLYVPWLCACGNEYPRRIQGLCLACADCERALCWTACV